MRLATLVAGSNKKATKAELIAQNSKRLEKKSHAKDSEKMENNNCLESLQNSTVETGVGKLQRVLKMLHITVAEFEAGGGAGEVRRERERENVMCVKLTTN